MSSKKSSKNTHDLDPQGAGSQGYYNGGYASYGGGYNEYKNNNAYGSYNPYGTPGYGGSIDRRASRDGVYPGPPAAGHNGRGGGGGVTDKWRNTYPYVPTSYNYHNNPRQV